MKNWLLITELVQCGLGDSMLGIIKAAVDLNYWKPLGNRSGNIFGSEDFEVKKINVWRRK